MTAPVVLLMGELGDERCGVGSSEVVLVPMVSGEVRVIDPTEGSFLHFRRALAVAAAGAAGAVVAYPTISQVERLRLIPRFLLVRLRMRTRWVRVHLHEFERLRRRHRIVVALVLGCVTDRTVVSSAREADALRVRYRGWGGRHPVVVVPPANGSAPDVIADSHPTPGTVGVFGQHRPDKGRSWLFATLEALDPRFDRLEVVGRDWETEQWPEQIRSRFDIRDHGQTPLAQLPGIIGHWELALAPYEEPPHDGRLSLRTPLAFGVPTLTRGPRPQHLQLVADHLLFDDEVELGHLVLPGTEARRTGVEQVAHMERHVRARLVDELFAP